MGTDRCAEEAPLPGRLGTIDPIHQTKKLRLALLLCMLANQTAVGDLSRLGIWRSDMSLIYVATMPCAA